MNGWPTELVRPRDFRGQICGVGRHINRPYLYFLAPTVDLNVGMCVEKCPEKPGTQICLYDGKTENILTHENFCYTQIECDTHGMYCYPQETEPRELVDAFLSKPEAVLRRMIGDLFLVTKFFKTNSDMGYCSACVYCAIFHCIWNISLA